MIVNDPQDGDVVVKEGAPTPRFFAFLDEIKRAIDQSTAPVSATTLELEDNTSTINTDDAKILGYQLLNSTTGATVFASGNGDSSVWHFYDESTAHTPI